MYDLQKHNEANRKWEKEHPERYREILRKAMKKYNHKNRKVINAKSLNYYYEHREEILKRKKEKRDREKLESQNKN